MKLLLSWQAVDGSRLLPVPVQVVVRLQVRLYPVTWVLYLTLTLLRCPIRLGAIRKELGWAPWVVWRPDT